MPQCTQRVELVRSTYHPQELIALGARLCYAGGDVDRLMELVSEKDQQAFLQRIMDMGHESVLEHASFTFLVEGISRVLLAQLTRHRIASFSVQSQRYVGYGQGFGYVVPPAIQALGEEAAETYRSQMDQMHRWYQEWQQQLGSDGEKSNEDARFVLPGACETRLLLTMNARELRHFFALRMCERAQWEIRALASAMYEKCYAEAPVLFANAGPSCLRGACAEGAKTCGKQREKQQQRAAFIQQGVQG